MGKKLYAYICLKNGRSVIGLHHDDLIWNGDAVSLATHYEENGMDGLIIFDRSVSRSEKSVNLAVIKEIGKAISIPMMGGGNIETMDDIRDFLNAGCYCTVLNMSKQSNFDMVKEASEAFGKDRIGVSNSDFSTLRENAKLISEYTTGTLLLGDNHHLYSAVRQLPKEIEIIPIMTTIFEVDKAITLLKESNVVGISAKIFNNNSVDLFQFKDQMVEQGVTMTGTQSPIAWGEMKLNSDGLIPVVVQDVANNEVLMVAYMNEDAFRKTLLTGRMTYWSRSRQELWIKGATSGHYQHLRQLSIDCDNDTLLAKVVQEGAACHTGNRSCFYRDILKKDADSSDTMTILRGINHTVIERQKTPVEGSHTTKLLAQGVDSLLRKFGEEAAAFIIASKNTGVEEMKHEAADLLYYMMVLMAERGLTWKEVAEEMKK